MKVNIAKRVKLDKGWRFCGVTKNARRVIVDGQELDLPGQVAATSGLAIGDL